MCVDLRPSPYGSTDLGHNQSQSSVIGDMCELIRVDVAFGFVNVGCFCFCTFDLNVGKAKSAKYQAPYLAQPVEPPK